MAQSRTTRATEMLKMAAADDDTSHTPRTAVRNNEKPLTSVQQMIRAKEQETQANRAQYFTPKPSNKLVGNAEDNQTKSKSVFVTVNNNNNNNNNITPSRSPFHSSPKETGEEKLRKSELARMNQITTAMPNSPSKKNLNKLKNIQTQLRPVGNTKTANANMKKTFSAKNLTDNLNTPSSIIIQNWLDSDRKNIDYAALVLRMIEIKRWIETVLQVSVDIEDAQIDQFPDYLANGILMAQIAQHFDPSVKNVYKGPNNNEEKINYKMTTKHFKFTENIITFLKFTKDCKLPSLFIFETNDLYEKKEIPKVIACLHTLSCLMALQGKAPPVESIVEEPSSISTILASLNVNVDTLKQMKHKIGRFTLNGKYLGGFEEAVRLSAGDDRKIVQMISLRKNDAPEELETNISITKEDDLPKPNDTTPILTIKEEEEVEPFLSGDLLLDGQTEELSSLLSESNQALAPPSSEDQEYTRDARMLFNATTTSSPIESNTPYVLPSMPSVHSISDIQEKYKFLIDEEERELLGYTDSDLGTTAPLPSSSFSTSSTWDNDSSTLDPKYDIIKFQSLARGYLLRFDLYVTKVILKGNVSSVISFQSICRGILARQKYDVSAKKSPVIDLQTYNELRTSNMMSHVLRDKQRQTKLNQQMSFFENNERDIINLQSCIRGLRLRDMHWKIRKFLLHEANLIIKLQSLTRGNIIRNKIRNDTYMSSVPVIRTTKQTKRVVSNPKKKIIKIEKSSISNPFIGNLQGKTPSLSPYDENDLFEDFNAPAQKSKPIEEDYTLPEPGKVPRRLEAKRANAKYVPILPVTGPMVPLKTPEKRSISKLQHSPTKLGLNNMISPESPTHAEPLSIPKMRSKKGVKVEDIITFEQMEDLENSCENVVALQALARGALSRNRMNQFIGEIYQYEHTFTHFSALAKGKLFRMKHRNIRAGLRQHQNEVIALQSLLRGIEVRVDHDLLVEDLEDFIRPITDLQSSIRAYLTRKRIKDREAWFLKPENLKKICTLQAYIRGFHGAQDFRALIYESNPPVRAVKKFIGVLGSVEGGKDNFEKLEIIQLKKDIKDEKANVKRELEKLSKLQIKVDILKKYGINLHSAMEGLQNNVKKGNMMLDNLADFTIEDNTNMDIGNVSTSKKANDFKDFIGTFFWILQNKSEYWSRVLNFVEMTGNVIEFSYGHIEDWILKCYNYGDADANTDTDPTREEYLFMKLIASTFALYINRVVDEKELKNIIKKRSHLSDREIKFWELLIHAYCNLPQQRKFTKTLLGDIVFIVTSDDELNFECDPKEIYNGLLSDGVKINNKDQTAVEIGTIEPLGIKQVEDKYVSNIKSLRDVTYRVIKNIRKLVPNLPTFIRTLCHELHDSLKQNVKISEDYVISLIGSIFLQCYVLPILISPENYSIDIYAKSDDHVPAAVIMRNLDLLATTLNQCFSMRHFDAKRHPYLTSLNGFIDEVHAEVVGLVNELINVPLLDVSYKKILLLGNENGQNTLKIQYDDVAELVCIWKEFMSDIFGESGDIMLYTLKEIENRGGIKVSDKNKDDKLIRDSYGYTTVVLKSCSDNEEEVESLISEAMLLETKRCLVYIMSVQDGSDLIELLVSEILPADEYKFKEIVKAEKKLMAGRQISLQEKNVINAIHAMSFPQLKKHTLGMIFELEKMGKITQSDGYQLLLNLLADDIKFKREQKEERDNEKALVVEILTELKKRSRTFKKKGDEYETIIMQALNKRLVSTLPSTHSGDEEYAVAGKEKFFTKLFSRSGRKLKKLNKQLRSSNKETPDAAYGIHKVTTRSLVDKGVIAADVGGSLVFKCNKPGAFSIVRAGMDETVWRFTLDELIQAVYEGRVGLKSSIGVEFVASALLRNILVWFYHV
jgi:Ras GTPase-activating-like protein IQGAP2/3